MKTVRWSSSVIWHTSKQEYSRISYFLKSLIYNNGLNIGKCLYYNLKMFQCRHQLTRRQALMQEDFRINHALADSCRADIKQHRCLRSNPNTETRHGRLSTILVCLEGAQKDGM